MHKTFTSVLMLTLASPLALAAETLRLYGPGGPAPAMKDVAAQYEAETGVTVEITAGPAREWMDMAKSDADALFSGSQNMMDAFVESHGGVQVDTITPLYLRVSTILVRKGNPDGITGVQSLLEPEVDVMVVAGAGQTGMWEDVVGRTRDVADMSRFRDNIVFTAPDSATAKERWIEDESIEAWLIWNHWQIDDPEIADMVAVEPDLAIYRDVSVAQTARGAENPALAAFLDYLESDAAASIFAEHGWQRSF